MTSQFYISAIKISCLWSSFHSNCMLNSLQRNVRINFWKVSKILHPCYSFSVSSIVFKKYGNRFQNRMSLYLSCIINSFICHDFISPYVIFNVSVIVVFTLILATLLKYEFSLPFWHGFQSSFLVFLACFLLFWRSLQPRAVLLGDSDLLESISIWCQHSVLILKEIEFKSFMTYC